MMFVAVQDPGEKSQVFVTRRGGVGEKNDENSLGWGVSSLIQMFAWVDNKVNRPRIVQKNILTFRKTVWHPDC